MRGSVEADLNTFRFRAFIEKGNKGKYEKTIEQQG